MVASVALFTLPYGAMIAIILDQVPDDIKASTTALTMFTVNVLIIGSATYFLGPQEIGRAANDQNVNGEHG